MLRASDQYSSAAVGLTAPSTDSTHQINTSRQPNKTDYRALPKRPIDNQALESRFDSDRIRFVNARELVRSWPPKRPRLHVSTPTFRDGRQQMHSHPQRRQNVDWPQESHRARSRSYSSTSTRDPSSHDVHPSLGEERGDLYRPKYNRREREERWKRKDEQETPAFLWFHDPSQPNTPFVPLPTDYYASMYALYDSIHKIAKRDEGRRRSPGF